MSRIYEALKKAGFEATAISTPTEDACLRHNQVSPRRGRRPRKLSRDRFATYAGNFSEHLIAIRGYQGKMYSF